MNNVDTNKKASGIVALIFWPIVLIAFIAVNADSHHNPALNVIKDFFKFSGSSYHISSRSRR